VQNEICTSNHDLFTPLLSATWRVAIALVPRSRLRSTAAVPVSYDLGSFPQLDSFLALIIAGRGG
jgi:hypothetical protein